MNPENVHLESVDLPMIVSLRFFFGGKDNLRIDMCTQHMFARIMFLPGLQTIRLYIREGLVSCELF